jgi:hypothetical protein
MAKEGSKAPIGFATYKAISNRDTRLESSVYVIDPQAPYDIADEVWEFPPGTRVIGSRHPRESALG